LKAQDLARVDQFILRQRDFDGASVDDDFKRLEAHGTLLRITRGAYVLVPEAQRQPNVTWRPTIEQVALGLAAASFGPIQVALIGPSAARVHGVVPRALSIATVSYPSTRPRDVATVCGTVRMYRRTTSQMDVVHINNDLVQGQVTSIEMTMLDLVSKAPNWPLGESDRAEAIRLLASMTDWDLATEIAAQYRKKTSLVSLQRMLRTRGGPLDS